MRRRIWAIAAAGMFAGALAAHADVVTLSDGSVLRGLIETTAGSAENITIRTDKGRLSIPKTRVSNVQTESPAKGHIQLGDAFRASQKYAEAMREYRAAQDLEPGNQEAQRGMDATQSAVTAQQNASRKDALVEIDTLTSETQRLIDAKQFDKAEESLKEADRRLPSDQQRAKLKKVISSLYYQWGMDRKDKLDPTGAEEKLRLALAADEDNRDAIEEMLRLWEDKPDKRPQIANIYATMLENHPNDNELRKKLADIYFSMDDYENAAKHYLELYQQSDRFRGTEVEERLKTLLDRLHRQYARNRNYDKAIQYFQMLAAIDNETDPSQVVYYQYLKSAAATSPDDAAGQLKLAQYAEQNGLDQQALSKYRALQKNQQTETGARQGIRRYAQKAFNDAQAQFKQGNYELAVSLADGARTEFADVTDLQDSISELINRAQTEAQRVQRQARERAKEILTRADEFYQQASNYFNDLFSTERKGNPYLMSTRNEASKYYNYAIQAYQDALRIDPSLGQDSNSLIMVRLNECKERLSKLQWSNGTQPFNPGARMITTKYSQSTTRR